MNIQPSHLVFIGGSVIYIVTRLSFQRRGAAEKKKISKASALDLLLVVFLGVAQTGLPPVLVLTPWLNWANYVLPPATLWVGAAVMASALWLFWRSHADLGNRWSVTLEISQNHTLVTQGVYRLIRHPMYASFFALGLAQALLLNNWFAGPAALVTATLLYGVRLPHEERMMLEVFGEEYRAYMQRTGRIVPRL